MNILTVTTRTLVALALIAMALPVAAMDVDELIAKNVEAQGGKDKIKGIETLTIEGNFMTQGMEIPFTMKQKRPDKMKIEASFMGMTMIQCFADGAGWSINPMMGSTDPQPMAEVESKSFAIQANIDGPLLGYQEKGWTATYEGEEDVEETPAYKLTLDTHDGIVIDFFIDKEYFLTIKQATRITIDTNEVESETYLSDFQEVEGIVMPFAVETRMGGVVANTVMMTSVKLNQEVDDAEFEMPEPTPAPAPTAGE